MRYALAMTLNPLSRRIDREQALALLDEIGNAAEVARRLGIHENTVRGFARLRKNVCVRCSAPAVIGKTMCRPCMDGERDRIKQTRKKRLRHGLCTVCGEPRSNLSRNLCEFHRIEAAKGTEAYRERLKSRGAPNKGIPNAHHKRQSILERYGQGGLDAWNYYDGCCLACGQSHNDVAVHIHHIDENRANNERSNFILLCFRCHRAIHILLSSKNRKGIIEVFEGLYPDKPLR